MGVSTREKSVLKLVHPGRHVEIHRSPITAAEVMRKNPRHCVARPDVFKYPWIVVRPESILVPGRVFYIVPNRTIHHLLKERGLCNQSSSRLKQSPKNHCHHCIPKTSSALKARSGTTLKHEHQDQWFQKLFQITPQDGASSKEEDSEANIRSWIDPIIKKRNSHREFDRESQGNSSVDIRPTSLLSTARELRNQPSSRQKQSPKNHDHHCTPRRASSLKPKAGMRIKHQHRDQCQDGASSQEEDSESYSRSWIDRNIKNKNTHHEFSHESQANSSVDIRPLHSREFHFDGPNIHSAALPKTKFGHLENKSNEQLNLKPCLRMPDSVRKSLNLRVTFASPVEIVSSGSEYEFCDVMGELSSLLTPVKL